MSLSFNKNNLKAFIHSSLLKNILFTIAALALFFFGMIGYGVVLNMREPTLKEAIAQSGFKRLQDVNVIIDRKTFTLNVYEDTVLIKSYRASFGRNLKDKKKSSNDGATPVGEYKICDIQNHPSFYKFLKINYPNLDDANEALRKSFLTQRDYNELRFQFYYEDCTNSDTPLGGNVGIQGIGRLNAILKNLPFVYNWTNGSIAISNEDINELLTVVKKGTKVVIK